MRSLALPCLIVVGTLLVGCAPTTTDRSGDAELPLGDVQIIATADEVVLPLDSFLPTVEQTVALMETGRGLIETCLKQEGSPQAVFYSVIDASTGVEAVAERSDVVTFVEAYRREAITYNQMWGFFDPLTVDEYGYGRPPGSSWSLSVSVSVTESCSLRVDSVSPAAHAAFPFSVSDLPDGGSPWHSEDSRFVAVTADWSRCMAQYGFSYATPVEAMSDNFLAETSERQALARAVAVADVQCKIDTNLVGVAVAVQSTYDQEYIDVHREALIEQQQYVANYLAGRVVVPAVAPSGAAPTVAAS